MKKKIYYGYCGALWGSIFVDQDFKYITFIHENDGNFREEYMSGLFTHFEIELQDVDWDEILKKAYRKLENGAINADEIDYEGFMKGKV